MDPNAQPRSYRPKPRPERRSFFGEWRDETFACPCGWTGPGRALTPEVAAYQAQIDYRCPTCVDTSVLVIPLPDPSEIARTGPPNDEEALIYRSRFVDRLTAEGFTDLGGGEWVKHIADWSTAGTGLHLIHVVPWRYRGFYQVRFKETVTADSDEAAIAAVEATYAKSSIKQRLDARGETPRRPLPSVPFPDASATNAEWDAWFAADRARAQAMCTPAEWAATGENLYVASLVVFGILPPSTPTPNPHPPWSTTIRIDELIQDLREHGGFALEVHGGRHPTSGYAVGSSEGSIAIPTAEFFEPNTGQEIIIDYLKRRAALNVGGWYSRSADTIVLMRVDVIDDWITAVTTGIERGQISIFDLNNREEILLPRAPTLSSGPQPRKSS